MACFYILNLAKIILLPSGFIDANLIVLIIPPLRVNDRRFTLVPFSHLRQVPTWEGKIKTRPASDKPGVSKQNHNRQIEFLYTGKGEGDDDENNTTVSKFYVKINENLGHVHSSPSIPDRPPRALSSLQ